MTYAISNPNTIPIMPNSNLFIIRSFFFIKKSNNNNKSIIIVLYLQVLSNKILIIMKWTEDEKKILICNYANHGIHELKEMLPNRTDKAIYSTAIAIGLKKSEEYMKELLKAEGERLKQYGKGTRFGNVPVWNKGKKGYMGANKTSFKKGDLPWNTKQEGDERIDKDGHTLVKVAHKKWVKKHYLLWESVNGKVPKGGVLRFKDGNPKNIILENLMLINQADNMRLNSIHQYPEDLKKTIKTLNKLKKTLKNAKQD